MPFKEAILGQEVILHEPKIALILANGLTNGGVTTWAINTARRLQGARHQCVVIAHTPDAGSDEFSRSTTDRILVCPGNASSKLPDALDISRFASCYASLGDATLLPNWSWGTWATVAAMLRNPEHQLRVIGIAHTDEKSYYDLMVYYNPIISKFIAVSDHIYHRLAGYLPDRQNDIIRLPYPTVLRPATPRSDLPRPCLKIGYAGRIQEYQKRIRDLPKLVAELATREGHYSFEIAGDGTHLEELQHFFEVNQFANVAVHFYGLLDPDDIAALWSSVDVAILFSSHEGLSIAMVESMAAGCVQLVTNVSGVSDTVNHGVTGYVHEIGDVAAMADHLQILWQQPELLSQMSAQGIDHARRHHDPVQYDLQFLKLVEEAWQQPQRLWPRFRRLIPARVIAEERSSKHPQAAVSLKGRIKLKLLAALSRLKTPSPK